MLSAIEKRVVADVNAQIDDMALAERIVRRLKSFNYELQEGDSFAVLFCLGKAENSIKNFCHINEVPLQLQEVWIDMCIGEFLLQQKNIGKLNQEEVVKSLRDGNITVEYDVSASDDTKLNILINQLMNGRRSELICYRRIKWW